MCRVRGTKQARRCGGIEGSAEVLLGEEDNAEDKGRGSR